jgi:hypothetical protein
MPLNHGLLQAPTPHEQLPWQQQRVQGDPPPVYAEPQVLGKPSQRLGPAQPEALLQPPEEQPQLEPPENMVPPATRRKKQDQRQQAEQQAELSEQLLQPLQPSDQQPSDQQPVEVPRNEVPAPDLAPQEVPRNELPELRLKLKLTSGRVELD